MREIDELRGLTAGRLLELWRESRRTADDPLEQSLLCNARILAECCFCRGQQVYSRETEVLKDLTGRQMERLLRKLSAGGGTVEAREENSAFDPARFAALRGTQHGLRG